VRDTAKVGRIAFLCIGLLIAGLVAWIAFDGFIGAGVNLYSASLYSAIIFVLIFGVFALVTAKSTPEN
jgi:hypothetical protein